MKRKLFLLACAVLLTAEGCNEPAPQARLASGVHAVILTDENDNKYAAVHSHDRYWQIYPIHKPDTTSTNSVNN